MSDHTHELRSRVLKTERVKFAHNVELGAGQREWLRFEREIIWLRDEATTWRASLNGQVMKEGGTWNGFYGPGRSLKEAVEAAAEWLGRFPQMDVEVVTTQETIPGVRAREEAFYEGAVKYHPLPGWLIADAALDAWIAARTPGWWKDHGVTRPETTKEATVVWRNGDWTQQGSELKDRLEADFQAFIVDVEAARASRKRGAS